MINRCRAPVEARFKIVRRAVRTAHFLAGTRPLDSAAAKQTCVVGNLDQRPALDRLASIQFRMIDRTLAFVLETAAQRQTAASMALRTRSSSAISADAVDQRIRHGPDRSARANPNGRRTRCRLHRCGWSRRLVEASQRICFGKASAKAGSFPTSGMRNGRPDKEGPAGRKKCGHRCTIRRRNTAIVLFAQPAGPDLFWKRSTLTPNNEQTIVGRFSPDKAAADCCIIAQRRY